jgi:hypothetical protein
MRHLKKTQYNMKILLISGMECVGKTTSIRRLTDTLIRENGFHLENCASLPLRLTEDFKIILFKNDFRIIINSASDSTEITNSFKIFFEENILQGYNILISSVRDDDFYPRKDFFETISQLSQSSDFTLEIPLAKTTRRGDNLDKQLKWYKEKIDCLLTHILQCPPYNIS